MLTMLGQGLGTPIAHGHGLGIPISHTHGLGMEVIEPMPTVGPTRPGLDGVGDKVKEFFSSTNTYVAFGVGALAGAVVMSLLKR
jgi:hypothetical protein